jgi:hypothetical protein
MVKIFLIHEEDVFVPVLSVPMDEMLCSCPSDRLQSRSKDVALGAVMHSHVLVIPDEAQH